MGTINDPPRVVWVPPSGVSANPTWASLSDGAKQAVFDSGLLNTYLTQAALSSGVKGVFAPGSLASQGLSNLTVIGAGNTSITLTGGIFGYPKETIWTFQSGIGWLARVPGSDKLYFPDNIPEATKRRSRPRWITDKNGVDGWVFPANDSDTPDSDSEKTRHGGGKNAQHGKAGNQPSQEEQVQELEEQLKNATTRREKVRIQQKIINIKREMERRRKGENHSQRDKK